MMDNLLTKWRRVPYTLSMFIWMVGILLIGDRFGASYFQSDFRLRLVFICIAAAIVAFPHQLIYKRQTLGEMLVSMVIMVPVAVVGVWISFAFFDADATLGFLPILVAVVIASGVDALARKRFRKA